MTQKESVCVCVRDCVMECVFASQKCFYFNPSKWVKDSKYDQQKKVTPGLFHQQLYSKQLCNVPHQKENVFI